jgi:alkylation response protein AidB-like acyl-CoA dehydrogenase
MNFAFTDDQLAFAGAVREVLRTHCPPAALRTERTPAWGRLAELGLFTALVPEEAGGLGLRLADLVPALEETGRACLPGPVAETAVAGPYLVAEPARLSGLKVGFGPGSLVADADLVDLVVSCGRISGTAKLEPVPGTDPCRRMFEVELAESAPVDTSVALPLVTVATAAQLLGVGRRLVDSTVAYARARTQFGVPVGSFQAVKHQLADAAVALEFAAPLVYRAALTAGPPARASAARDVSAAKAAAGEAALLAARVALQVHGAVGYTEELDLRFWLARARSLSSLYGTGPRHRATVRATLTSAPRYP